MSVEQLRLQLATNADRDRRSEIGQFLTPASVASFMAGLFPKPGSDEVSLLDPGAGIGTLTAALLERWALSSHQFRTVHVDAFELDEAVRSYLSDTFSCFHTKLPLTYRVIDGDFIERALDQIQFEPDRRYTHAILNPPYKKINSDSRHRRLLRHIGLETVNLYSAFVGLALELLLPGGHLVAIIPRSFCNGPYYKPFRLFLMKRAAIHHIHLFSARNKAFQDDAVLQENVIICLERDGVQGDVTISTSTDDTFVDLAQAQYPFSEIVLAGDSERFIHVPTSREAVSSSDAERFHSTLAELGIDVLTGPVVDFRLKDLLRRELLPGSVPLLYPGHFADGLLDWPRVDFKKPNALLVTEESARWLLPAGYYTVVRRFSSKEEKRRIVASVIDPSLLPALSIGIENHLNVFHAGKRGISPELAFGLSIYLNSTFIDEVFRRFSGHTQVNAADLRRLRYPPLTVLYKLGAWCRAHPQPLQEQIDQVLKQLS